MTMEKIRKEKRDKGPASLRPTCYFIPIIFSITASGVIGSWEL